MATVIKIVLVYQIVCLAALVVMTIVHLVHVRPTDDLFYDMYCLKSYSIVLFFTLLVAGALHCLQ